MAVTTLELETPVAVIQPGKHRVSTYLKQAVEVLETEELPFIVVGSVAVASYVPDLRPPDTLGDVDILTPYVDDARQILDQFDLIATKQGDPKKVDLGFNITVDLSDPDQPALKYRKTSVPVDPSTFVPVAREFDGITFPTVPARTLQHLQKEKLRPQDVSSARALLRWLRQNPEQSPPETQYSDYHQFWRDVERKYPLSAWFWKLDKQAICHGMQPWNNRFEEKFPFLGNYPSRARAKMVRVAGAITEKI